MKFEIESAFKKFKDNPENWPQFLKKVKVSGLRGWDNQEIIFNTPIVVLCGENGTGKTTILKAAIGAYENKQGSTYFPSLLFPDTVWDRIQNAQIEYLIKLGKSEKTITYRKKSERWRLPEKRPQRSVFYFDIARTLPLDATVGYAKVAKQAATDVGAVELSTDYREKMSYVLNRNYSTARFVKPDADPDREVGLLRREFGEISQFHQGAGEDVTLDIFKTLEAIPDYSLVVIDEVENSLHPLSQRRFIHFLGWLCRQKKLQIILSTHSPFVLDEIPKEGRILVVPSTGGAKEILTGISSEMALTRMDDRRSPDLYCFVEDKEAKVLLLSLLQKTPLGQDCLKRIDVLPVGASSVVETLGALLEADKLPYKGVAILDGDQKAADCLNLPGTECPEKLVFSGLKAIGWKGLEVRFDIGAGSLYQYLEDAMLIPDHHKWTEYVGDKLLRSTSDIWSGLVAEWTRQCAGEAEALVLADSINKKF
ncbi:ATP-dependent nuclease [Bdellovibrio bacteriovorus]|uniref:ATP-dependent nuclease n=1 Tax=Bdellovibrio bacteriovorus TaxID=959 RepID=UPI003D06007A